jgi:hypothetical protein
LLDQGDEVKSSHNVQSVRAKVEHTFADLKNFKIMSSNKISTVADFEITLDNIMALHNLMILLKHFPNFDLPPRRAAITGEHIFHPLVRENDVDLKIPADPVDLTLTKYRHINEFTNFLTSASKAIREAIETGENECIFFPTVGFRGRNLYNGAYVLQLQVQDEGLGVWTVKYLVGASYSYEIHTGYFQMSRDDAAINHNCECFSG